MQFHQTSLAQEATRVFLGALDEIEVATAVNRKLGARGETLLVEGEEIALSRFDRVLLVGFGKASIKMGYAVEALLGDRITDGLLVTDRRHSLPVRSRVIVAGHPIPDANSLVAARAIIELIESSTERTLILFLVSGGGSALVELPLSDAISLEDLQQLNRTLVTCGASIAEINVVRKHLSAVKGGKLGALARNATSVALLISDVNPGDLHSIASNPVFPDPASLDQFYEVVYRYELLGRMPRSIAEVVSRRAVPALPKQDSGEGKGIITCLLLENADAVRAAARLAGQLRFRVDVVEDLIEGPYQRVADELIERLERLRSESGERVALVSGGEVTCEVRGDGVGGRNQQFVLYSATRIAELGVSQPTAVLSCGTDGIDGNSPAAGAVVSELTASDAERLGLDVAGYLDRNDCYSFFSRSGGVIVTGPTGNNVRDVRILLAEP